MKTWIAFPILCILVSGMFDLLSAQEIQIVTENYPPFNYFDPESGRAEGISTELIQALLQEVNIQAKIKFYPWVRSYSLAEREPNILIFSMKRTAARENKFKWVGELLKTNIYFIALKGSPIAPTSDIDNLKGYIIGSIRGGSTAKALQHDGFKIEVVTDRNLNWKKLKKRRIDLWCTELLSAHYTIKTSGDNPDKIHPIALYEKVSGDSLYAAFSRQTDDKLVEKFRRGFEKVKYSTDYNEILKKYGMTDK